MKTKKREIIDTFICNSQDYKTDDDCIEAIKNGDATIWDKIDYLDSDEIIDYSENEQDAYYVLNR